MKRTVLLIVLWLFFLAWLSVALAISYTVQVVAFSDEPRARRVQSELASQGYPAYLIAVPTAQGQVYRIRVGAFANRAAAALFAQTMPSVEGSTPSPALAEGGVPPGLIPLAPSLLGQYDLTTTLVQVFPWPTAESEEAPQQDSSTPPNNEATDAAVDEPATTPSSEQQNEAASENTEPSESETSSEETNTTNNVGANNVDTSDVDTNNNGANEANPDTTDETLQPSAEETDIVAQTEQPETEEVQSLVVIRTQPRDASQQAHYKIGELEFDAWKAAPIENNEIVRVRSLSVWPDDWQNVSEAERIQYRETVLANVASDLDLTPQQVEPFVFELDNQAPFIVLVERFNPETESATRLRAIGQPRPNEENLGLRSDGPSSFFGETISIPLPAANTVFEPSSTSEAPSELIGNGWQASSDGDYVTLLVGDKEWRAANGKPLWANGDLLISLFDNQVLIYQFQQP
jgi:SPOR domain